MGTAASKMTPVGEGRESRPWEGPGQAARNGANEKIQAKRETLTGAARQSTGSGSCKGFKRKIDKNRECREVDPLWI